jgi:1,4-dihydroxy-2-naphthoate octaprenyltransferase
MDLRPGSFFHPLMSKFMPKMSPYLKALRAPFLAGSVVPVLVGAAFAVTKSTFVLGPFFVTVLGVSALHLGANLLNDYYDARGSDPVNVRLTPFSGGSRVIPNGEIVPGVILSMGLFCFGMALTCGFWLTWAGRPLVLLLGFLGLACGWTYSAPPFQFMSRGWGEVLIFLAFGPLITFGTYYVMSGSLSGTAFALGLPQGFLITAVIWINQFPDYEADREVGKRNLVVRWGPRIARFFYGFIVLSAFLAVLFLISVMALPYLIMLSFIPLPMAFNAMKILWREYQSHERIVPAQAMTIKIMMVHGLLLSLGLILDWVWRG